MSIRTTVETETIRLFDKDCGDIQKPPYKGVVKIDYIVDTVARASMAYGTFNKGDVRRIYAHLRSRGVKILLADRAAAHRMPGGTLIQGGPLAGMFEVKLDELN